MTTQHTPGPWEVRDYELGLKAISTPNIKNYLATEIDAADARLIAAAPDLLAALENMVSHFPHWAAQIDMKQIDRDAIGMAREAIAKAKGAA